VLKWVELRPPQGSARGAGAVELATVLVPAAAGMAVLMLGALALTGHQLNLGARLTSSFAQRQASSNRTYATRSQPQRTGCTTASRVLAANERPRFHRHPLITRPCSRIPSTTQCTSTIATSRTATARKSPGVRQEGRRHPHIVVSASPRRPGRVLRARRQPKLCPGQPLVRPRPATGDLCAARPHRVAIRPAGSVCLHTTRA
jgi:hypothetical protein